MNILNMWTIQLVCYTYDDGPCGAALNEAVLNTYKSKINKGLIKGLPTLHYKANLTYKLEKRCSEHSDHHQQDLHQID